VASHRLRKSAGGVPALIATEPFVEHRKICLTRKARGSTGWVSRASQSARQVLDRIGSDGCVWGSRAVGADDAAAGSVRRAVGRAAGVPRDPTQRIAPEDAGFLARFRPRKHLLGAAPGAVAVVRQVGLYH
jgi:hypothetical protein